VASKRGERVVGGWIGWSLGRAHSHLVHPAGKNIVDRHESWFIISGVSVRLLINGVTARASPLISREFWMPTARDIPPVASICCDLALCCSCID
jgi:hypothetical protein